MLTAVRGGIIVPPDSYDPRPARPRLAGIARSAFRSHISVGHRPALAGRTALTQYAFTPTPRPHNRLLAALPQEDRSRLTSGAERVHLTSGSVLFDAGEQVRHAFFPLSGMVSIISATPEGKSVETATVGSEGMAGLPAILGEGILPYQAMAQLPLGAVRVSARSLRAEFDRGGRLKELLLGHALTLLTQVTQSASCHRFHTVEQRLARWLLTTRDRAVSNRFRLTQEFLSFMLGVPRTSVTSLAAAMQAKGMISYSRGANPTPVYHTSLGTDTVHHGTQTYRIGSYTAGEGKRVSIQLLQFYLDHANQQDFVTPSDP
jgi:CRP-like cAMP-binding protein